MATTKCLPRESTLHLPFPQTGTAQHQERFPGLLLLGAEPVTWLSVCPWVARFSGISDQVLRELLLSKCLEQQAAHKVGITPQPGTNLRGWKTYKAEALPAPQRKKRITTWLTAKSSLLEPARILCLFCFSTLTLSSEETNIVKHQRAPEITGSEESSGRKKKKKRLGQLERKTPKSINEADVINYQDWLQGHE